MVNNLMKKIDDKNNEMHECLDGRLVDSLKEHAGYVSDVINSNDINASSKAIAFAENATKPIGVSNNSSTKLESSIAYV